jgi:uncharacterized protein YbjT (DUF2867 family)
MILVVGATGMVGSEVCARLVAQGKQVGALVRPSADAAKVKKLEALGVELLPGDLRQPETLEAACDRAGQVIVTASSMSHAYQPGVNDMETTDTDGVRNLISLAAGMGVDHFVFTSISGNLDLDFPLNDAKRSVEEALEKSDMTSTILRPSFFMETWLSPAVGFDPANAKATIYGTGEKPVSYISYRDVAQFAVLSLDVPEARNATLELGGPQPISQLEAVKIFEEVTRRQFELQSVPEQALREQQAAAADPMQRTFAGLMRCLSRGDAIDMNSLLKVFPVKLTSVREYAEALFMPA